jgi:hypothetical protein
MTQPKFTPILIEDEVRKATKLAVPRPWSPHRPSEFRPGPRPSGGASGAPGPDQGYALTLAARLAPRVVLAEGERIEDAIAAALAIGLRRAAIFGRAPVSADLEFALASLGFLGSVDAATAVRRQKLISGLSHDYFRQRRLADICDETALRAPVGTNGAFLLTQAESVL